ncbi:transmembrane protein 254-like isoform X1 [Onychostoma macrolepis]|uniref:Transmembrane protein 254 n=1 Tax=Onychostoma macrolepis TaxID=369639 RepID=A0A7J6CHY4_9TELE|nr:transmembrane protein 254-like isoform X1 [Onychostoma macrolepis]KAF4106185.1 hypothetical protein G5714_013847 [Onychostoma macrolepis]
MAKSDGCSYFKRTSPFCMVVVTIYVCLHTWMAFWPQYIPYGILGPLGALAKRFMDYVHPALYYGWFLMLAIHVCEALLALKICSDKGIDSTSTRLLWLAQTFLFGLTSLGHLVKYSPDGRTKRQ